MGKYDLLKIENQLCIPLYTTARGVVNQYFEPLKAVGLTYTQYITMMALWDKGDMNVKALGECLYLDNGTLTPVIRKLMEKGLVEKKRDQTRDERVVNIVLTDKGQALKEKALSVPMQMADKIHLDEKDVRELKRLLSLVRDQVYERR